MQMLQFASEFRQDPTLSPAGGTGDATTAPISSTTLQQLTSVAQDFDELANTCLLLLHLEVYIIYLYYYLYVL